MSKRQGTSEAEAALVWAVAKFGGSEDLFASLEPASRGAARSSWRSISALRGGEEKDNILSEWARADLHHESPEVLLASLDKTRLDYQLSRMDARWLRLARATHAGGDVLQKCVADPGARAVVAKITAAEVLVARRPARDDLTLDPELGFDVAHLWSWSPESLERLFVRVGTLQLAESWRRLDRRQLARLLRAMKDRQMQTWVREDLAIEREADRVEITRLREVISGLSKHFTDQRELALHLGMFYVGVAAGRRHAQRIEVLARGLPTHLSNTLRGYAAQTHRSSRQDLEIPTAAAITALLERWSPDADEQQPANEQEQEHTS